MDRFTFIGVDSENDTGGEAIAWYRRDDGLTLGITDSNRVIDERENPIDQQGADAREVLKAAGR